MSEILYIYKRDGQIMPFDAYKIREAIRKANLTIPYEAADDAELDRLMNAVVERIPADQIPNVEQVQDLVEQVLLDMQKIQTAKAYIIYREEHRKRRETTRDLMDIYKSITFEKASDNDLMRENANIDANTAMGSMLKYGSEGSKYFVDEYILPADMAEAHRDGSIHIHDKDFYMLTETCCQIDLTKLFEHGFSTGHGYLRKPQSIQSYTALACIAIQANQNEMHGGQSIPDFDFAMAPGVNRTFAKHFERQLQQTLSLLEDFGFLKIPEGGKGTVAAQVRQALGELPADRLIDEKSEELMQTVMMRLRPFLSERAPVDGVRANLQTTLAAVYRETDKDTYQAMQALVHNLNTMNSRAGAQVPFSSINYGTDTSAAGRMVIRNLLQATQDGLGNGETPIFPVQIFKVKEGINYNPEDPNYDLFRLSMETSAMRLFPNFSFLDAPFNLQYYKPGDPRTEVAYMGCRTRVIGNIYDPNSEITMGRGNLSFTSINLPRLGIQARGKIDRFYEALDQMMDLCARQLLHRYKIQAHKTVRNYPFLMGQRVWHQSDHLGPDDEIGEVLKHGTLSIGFIGLAETLTALTGKHHAESADSQKLGLEIVSHMRAKTDQFSREFGMNFTLLATPAEGLSGRFVRMDAEKFGVIKGITDREYYTNSFHVPVYHHITAYRKIELEAPYHALTNAGHISYVELDGDTNKNLEAFEAVVRCMKENGIGYGSVNHPVDRDPLCGYTGVIDEICPRCGRRDGEGLPLERIEELRKRYPNIPTRTYGHE